MCWFVSVFRSWNALFETKKKSAFGKFLKVVVVVVVFFFPPLKSCVFICEGKTQIAKAARSSITKNH